MRSWGTHPPVGWDPWTPEKVEVTMRGMWAFSCLSERVTHPQTAEVAVQSLQPAPHPTFLLVFSAQEGGLGELYSGASGPGGVPFVWSRE